MRDFQKPGRSVLWAANGACATSHPLAAKVAVDILERGGNAADAAIAGAVLLGLCEPQSTGLGGDCFVLMTPPGEDRVLALNASGRAPAALSAAQLRARGLTGMPLLGVEAVTVPGAVDGFCRLSADRGRMPLADVLAPAIRYAEEGVPVAPRVSRDWAEGSDGLTGAARKFFLTAGAPLAEGQMFRAPGQAEVLRRIARDGRAGFYEGEVADDMVASLRALGGVHTAEDFATNTCDWGEPVSGDYGDWRVSEHPPNGQGATAILILNILRQFDLSPLDPLGAQRIHLETEAARLAYALRDEIIADPAHVTRLDEMLSLQSAERLAGLIDPDRAMPDGQVAAGRQHRDTVYLCVVDRDRMAVSIIYSIFWGFGAGLASERFGLLFQNRGAGFTLAEGHPNEAGGGKRPLHTIIPGMLHRGGRLAGPFGVMGGAYQPTGHARFVTNLVDFGMDLQEAFDAPRSFWQNGMLEVERGYPPAVRARLEEMGHRVVEAEEPLGGGQAILIGDGGALSAGSDPRKDGIALGY
ncbi:MAG: gamma-glutamyltransferase family protein [Rubellimicrobium sp.]|nr:gamma-glutamyltransferase family protein [Rubellimicrobium sp.]